MQLEPRLSQVEERCCGSMVASAIGPEGAAVRLLVPLRLKSVGAASDPRNAVAALFPLVVFPVAALVETVLVATPLTAGFATPVAVTAPSIYTSINIVRIVRKTTRWLLRVGSGRRCQPSDRF